MADKDSVPSIQTLPSPWLDTLLEALSSVQHSLLMVSPYIKENAVERIQQALLAGASLRPGARSIRIITRVNPDDLLSGASDIAALQRLLDLSIHLPTTNVELRAIPNLHAKIWVCDEQLAIIGSGNATMPGLTTNGNLEYGLLVTDPPLIKRILSDWQPWWEQAQQVEATALQALANQLQAIKASEDMRQLQTRNEQLKQRLKALPRIGKPVHPRKRASHPFKEPPASYATNNAQEAISVLASDLWQALRWVLPLDEAARNMISTRAPSNANLKIAWRPAVPQQLQLIWADGTRSSQATLPAHNDVLKQPWAITLNMTKIRLLGEMFKQQDDLFIKRAQQHLHLLLKTSPYTLLIAYPYNSETNAAIDLPCAPTGLPGPFPTLQSPRTCITVAHKDLQHALQELKQENHPSIIELRLTPKTLTLTTGQIEAALTQSIEAINSEFTGPEISIRVDADALQQVVYSPPSSVEAWRVCVDGYAEAVQFSPEPAVLAEGKLVWRHEVRGR